MRRAPHVRLLGTQDLPLRHAIMGGFFSSEEAVVPPVVPVPAAGGASDQAAVQAATARVLDLAVDAEARMLRMRALFNQLHQPYVAQTQQRLEREAARAAAEAEAGGDASAAPAAQAGSDGADGGSDDGAGSGGGKAAEAPPPVHPVERVAGLLDSLNENVFNHFLFFRAPTAPAARTFVPAPHRRTARASTAARLCSRPRQYST